MSDTAAFLRRHEGLRLTAYQDAKGLWTWGYGTRINDPLLTAALNAGVPFTLTLHQAEALLTAGIFEATHDARILFPSYGGLSPLRQTALISLAYHLGRPNLSKWHGLAEAIRLMDWPRAANEVLFKNGLSCTEISTYAGQFPARAHETAALFLDPPA